MKNSRVFNSLGNFIRAFTNNGKPAPMAIAILLTVALVVITLLLILFTAVIQWLWGWLVPDLFPSLVRDGALAGSITFWTAFKIVIALFILSALFRGNNTTRVHKNVERPASLQAAASAEEATGSEVQANQAPASARVFPTLVDPLTDRELEVLQLLGKGLTNQQIAAQLSLSESTVVYHIGHIFGKLRVNSRVEAAVWAKEHGII